MTKSDLLEKASEEQYHVIQRKIQEAMILGCNSEHFVPRELNTKTRERLIRDGFEVYDDDSKNPYTHVTW